MVWLWAGLGVLGLIVLFRSILALGVMHNAVRMLGQPVEGGVNFLAGSASLLLAVVAWLQVLVLLAAATVVVLALMVAPAKAAEPYTGTDVKAMKQYCRTQAREALAHDDVKAEIKLYMWCATDWFLAHPDVYAGHF